MSRISSNTGSTTFTRPNSGTSQELQGTQRNGRVKSHFYKGSSNQSPGVIFKNRKSSRTVLWGNSSLNSRTWNSLKRPGRPTLWLEKGVQPHSCWENRDTENLAVTATGRRGHWEWLTSPFTSVKQPPAPGIFNSHPPPAEPRAQIQTQRGTQTRRERRQVEDGSSRCLDRQAAPRSRRRRWTPRAGVTLRRARYFQPAWGPLSLSLHSLNSVCFRKAQLQ